MKNSLTAFCLSLLFFACGENKNEKTEELYEDVYEESAIPQQTDADGFGAKKFWNALMSLCGKAFEGEVVKAPENDDFRGHRLVMHVLSCSEDEILIPFNVGENRSRTWIFKYKNGRIELKHDHRLEDGSDDQLTMYGGTTTNSGLPDIAVFPADQQTVDLIEPGASNVWWVTVNDEAYTYNLRRLGTDREFSVLFDLGREVEIPEPSWGWEDFSTE